VKCEDMAVYSDADRFFLRFIGFDCDNELQGIDAPTIHWIRR
jgi:hypothetical protein